MAVTAALQPTRRSFLYVATGAVAGVGTTFALWPLVDQMNPGSEALEAAMFEVDLTQIGPGGMTIFRWNDIPIEIRHLTEQEIMEARTVGAADLWDRKSRNANMPRKVATHGNRTVGAFGEFVVVVSVCTWRGCELFSGEGRFGGWYCPCCGSSFDVVGRIRHGPAPENLMVPAYELLPGGTLLFNLAKPL